ncbi:MAG: transposase [Planctomycetia bacterium]
MVAKYAYHVPAYRQQDLFAAHGWTPARSTLLNVLKAAAHLIRPLVAHLREVVRAGPIIGIDDTTATLLGVCRQLPVHGQEIRGACVDGRSQHRAIERVGSDQPRSVS